MQKAKLYVYVQIFELQIKYMNLQHLIQLLNLSGYEIKRHRKICINEHILSVKSD